jgi:dihydrofolate reductase
MSLIRMDLHLSLDGLMSAGQSEAAPMGDDWGKLTKSYVSTKTFQSRVMGDTSGKGTTGIDDKYAAAYFENIGAEIMGASMFGFTSHPDDADWKGWWGDTPPFGYPVFVMTHRAPRDPLVMDGGTTFHFRTGDFAPVIAEAKAAAAGKDIRISGGSGLAKAALEAGVVDRLHLNISPVVLGEGISFGENLRELESSYEISSEVSESGSIHVTFTRR